MAEIWGAIAAGAAVAGVGASLYGANKASKDAKAAQSANADLQTQQNNSAWQSYLMSRGINPQGAPAGVIPSGPPINARLPLWATANFKVPGAQPTWRKKGTPAANTLSRVPMAATPMYSAPVDTAPAGSGGGSSFGHDVLIGNPLGIGGKNRSFFDPLGIF